jgi:hypothetical protein
VRCVPADAAANSASISSLEQLPLAKWVRDPIGERARSTHASSVTRGQRKPATAPFDAALPYTAAAALSLAIGTVVALPTPFRIGLPTVLMAAALSRALAAYSAREQQREQADAWLAAARSPNPSAFGWRVDELTGPERKTIGRTLRSIAHEVRRPRRRGAPILNRLQLRPEIDLLLEVAQALQDPERTASPRAIASTRLLITNCGSPLNSSARHDELHQALTSILAGIAEPRPIGEYEQKASPQRGAAEQPMSRIGTARSALTLSCEHVMNDTTPRSLEQ